MISFLICKVKSLTGRGSSALSPNSVSVISRIFCANVISRCASDITLSANLLACSTIICQSTILTFSRAHSRTICHPAHISASPLLSHQITPHLSSSSQKDCSLSPAYPQASEPSIFQPSNCHHSSLTVSLCNKPFKTSPESVFQATVLLNKNYFLNSVSAL